MLVHASGCNIGCKTLFSERGMLASKLTCPAGTSTCPATLLNKGEIGLYPKHYLPSGACQGLIQLAPLPFFAEFTCNLQRGQWLCCTRCMQANKVFDLFFILNFTKKDMLESDMYLGNILNFVNFVI